MTQSQDAPGTMMICDLDGRILRIAYDGLGLGARAAVGTAFVELVDGGSRRKADRFVAKLRSAQGAYDLQVNVLINGTLVLLHCMGCRDESMLLVIMARSQVAATQVLEEMCLMQNEHVSMLRSALKASGRVTAPAADQSQFDQLTRLNSELTNMQRELAQRNAELEALRAALEARQTELVAANARLDAMATTDALTGIANRRVFESRLASDFARARRQGSPLSLMILDLDHFKKLNDTHGHQAGDEVLAMMGVLLASGFRETDLIARYGGEEFAAVLVESDKDAATKVAERLRERMSAELWPNGPVTASIGIATLETGVEKSADLLARADEALYASKDLGRNRVTHWNDLHPVAQKAA